jgi:ribosome-associated protein
MAKTKKLHEGLVLSDLAVHGLIEKKGKDIVTLDLRNIRHAVTDYFVVCHGDSNTQVDALADSVEYEIHKATGENPWHREGKENSEWVILDYVHMVVHIFQKDKREFYGIESLWADAPMNKVAEGAV